MGHVAELRPQIVELRSMACLAGRGWRAAMLTVRSASVQLAHVHSFVSVCAWEMLRCEPSAASLDFVMLLSVCMGGPPRAGPMESSTAPRNRLNVYGVIDSVSLDPGPSPFRWRGGISVRLDWNDDYGDRPVIVATIP